MVCLSPNKAIGAPYSGKIFCFSFTTFSVVVIKGADLFEATRIAAMAVNNDAC